MPAPKGIPIPEGEATRLDLRVYDSRTTWGWASDDDRLVATHSGEVLFAIDPECMSWDERSGDLMLSIHPIDARRLLRWMRHSSEHRGNFPSEAIRILEQ